VQQLLFIKAVVKGGILKIFQLVLGIRCMEFYLHYTYAPTVTYIID
jgi:hypothetical protein